MIVEVVTGVEERPEARVVDVDDLATVHLALGVVTDDEAAQSLEHAGLGRLHDGSTAHLDVAALRAAAEPRAGGDEWVRRWDALIAGARADGRLSADGATLEVPVESAAGA